MPTDPAFDPAFDPALDPALVAPAVRAERRSLADLVAHLDDDQWATPSLCAAWTVRDVIAHLTVTTRMSVPKVVVAAARARGSFDRMELRLTAARAARFTTPQLVEQLRESATSDRRMPFSGPMDPLMDLVIHAQDVARPLGLRHTSPADVVTACLAYVADNRFMGGPKRLDGVRLVSSDSAWTRGEGPEVTGPDIDLLMVASGRASALDALDGSGLERLRERVG